MSRSPLNRGNLRFFLVLIALVAGGATSTTILYGTPIVALGVLVHLWAKGCLRQNRLVTMTGPYRFVRHPFYLANALVDGGIAIMSGWWPLQLLLPMVWLAVYIPVIRGEEAHLTGLFGAIYADYKKRVPMLFPFRRPISAADLPAAGRAEAGTGFSWRNPNIASGRELPRALKLMAYPPLFLLIGEVRAALPSLAGGWYEPALLGLALMLVLYGLAWEFTRSFKQKRLILPPGLHHPLFRLSVGIAILAVAFLMNQLETELDSVVLPAGAALLILSAFLFSRRIMRSLVAEGLVLAGAAVACELLWLAAVPILVYGALMLDERLAGDARPPDLHIHGRVLRPSWPMLYHFFLIAGSAAATLKEILF